MKRAKSDTELAEALRAWGRSRILVLAVKDARNGLRCEREHVGSFEPDDPAEPPCWKGAEWDYAYEPAHPEDWCAPCLERQRWHIVLVAVRRIHGGRLRRIQAISLAPALQGPRP